MLKRLLLLIPDVWVDYHAWVDYNSWFANDARVNCAEFLRVG
jgi:hypothetical protein